jgi:hypothetical protein
MRKQISIPPNLDRALTDALQKRNWLAHEYFWARAGEVMTTRGRDKMIAELTEISNSLSRVDANLVSIYEKWTRKLGISQAVLDENLRKLTSDNE